jgi:thioredoxin 1
MVKDISDNVFDSEVLKSDIPVIVDFWAPWCGPCRVVSPIIEELSKTYEGKIKFTKVNVDENPEKASQYQIFSIPNMKIFKNGKLVDEIVGVAPKEEIEKLLRKQL